VASALVLLSGGQDSSTCLFWALKAGHGGFERVEAVAFAYGQRHGVELEQARVVADIAGVPLTVLDLTESLGASVAGASALIGGGDVSTSHPLAANLPASFVPGRNAVFLAQAAAFAYARGNRDIVFGASQTDYSGYPDCRREFVDAMQQALGLALDTNLSIHTPLMDLSKAETWRLAKELGVLETIVEHTHTDYYGDRSERHPWGYGKLDNPASVLRAKGWEEAKARGWI
jgi:7-cyano-7-deazaguanine synthase